MTTPGFDDPLLRETPVVDGYRVLGPCVIYTKIGQGGMGAVFRGRHVNLEIDVAVKCLKKSLASEDEAFVQRFQREARLAASLNDPNLIRVYDVNEQSGLHFLVMEFVEGESLRERVERKGALDPLEAATIVRHAAQGLGVAHDRGIVHRDIKPDNVLVASSGEVKVADLGLAKAVEAKDGMTATNMVMGTPQYMPPEQWEGSANVGAPGDVYALGATLFFLIAGRDPIAGGSLTEVLRRVCFEPFPDIAEAVPGLDPALAEIVRAATAKEEGVRPADAGALRERLDAWLRGQTSAADLSDAAAGQESPRRTLVSPPPAATLGRARTSSFINVESETKPAHASEFVAAQPAAPPPPPSRPTVGATKTSVQPASRKLPAALVVGVTALAVAGLMGLGFAFLGGDDPKPGPEADSRQASVDPGNDHDEDAASKTATPTNRSEAGDSKGTKSSTKREGPAPAKKEGDVKSPTAASKNKGDRVAAGAMDRDARAAVGRWVLDEEAYLQHLVAEEIEKNGLDPDESLERLEVRLRRRAAGNELEFELKKNGRFNVRSVFRGSELRGLGSWRRERKQIVLSTEFEGGRRLVKPREDAFRLDTDRLTAVGETGGGVVLLREEVARARERAARRAAGDVQGRWKLDKDATVTEIMRILRAEFDGAGGGLPDLSAIAKDQRDMLSELSVDLRIQAKTFRMQAFGADGSSEGEVEGVWQPRGNKFEFTTTKEDGEHLPDSSRQVITVERLGGKLLFRSEDEPMVFRKQ